MSRVVPGVYRPPSPSVAALACALAFVVPASVMPASAQTTDEEPFIVFDRAHPLMPDDGVPMVQVFDSGRVVVTRGPGRTRPGRTEHTLGAAELERLKALAASGASVEPPAVVAPVREIVDGREVFTVVHDPVTTSMRVRVSGADGGIALAGASPTVREIEVEGLAELADAPVTSLGIDALVELERSLLDVFERPAEPERGR